MPSIRRSGRGSTRTSIITARVTRGEEAARILIANQLEGLKRAAEYGMTIKVNTVLIPGVNEDQMPLIGRKVKELGAFVMNVMPLIPQADFAGIVAAVTGKAGRRSGAPTKRSSASSSTAGSAGPTPSG